MKVCYQAVPEKVIQNHIIDLHGGEGSRGFDRGKVVTIWTSSKGMNGMSEGGGRNSGAEGTGFLIGM